ncbi:MAG: alpha-glucuronidase family glycosyl hydrolase [Candidatus Poribacteria bacterium]|nr:alpha-glucuronidase family glycosyl hydrolase [Candidatus Poribacteria bacterium]
MNIIIKWLSAIGYRLSAASMVVAGVFSHHKVLLLTAESRLLMTLLCFVGFVAPARSNQIPIAVSGEPRATLQIGANASEQEAFAVTEIQTFIQKFTGAKLDIRTNRQETETQTVIVLGTPKSNPTIATLQANVELKLAEELGDDGYRIKTVEVGTEIVIVVTAHTERGVIYGAYAFIEQCITALTGLTPVHPDISVAKAQALLVPFINETSAPFYPVRAVLEIEDPDWLARHRMNMSGGEGVWTGTGIEDGFGTAFKYVDTPVFEALQDEPIGQRRERIATLKKRFNALKQRGIDAYLFMYVTGEPTEALIRQRPDVLGPAVLYGASRNEVSYRPFCWSKPAFHTLARELTQAIVRNYPALAGFHLRSWGHETRACDCPDCGDRTEQGQAKLWQVYFTIIKAAREVRPDFKFYISGYDSSWLKDAAGVYARQLPKGTIFSRKWGADGEPVADAGVPIPQIRALGEIGHNFIVLSHEVEEVMPLWMLESDLFVQGVRQLANNPEVVGLGGFTVQGATQGLGYLDRLVSARLNWDIKLDHLQLLRNELIARYGAEAAPHILNALRINGWNMASYFSDYAGSLTVGGTYGSGSAGLATRFWTLIGPRAVEDTLAIPELEIAKLSVNRFTALLAPQQQAANQIRAASEIAEPFDQEATEDLRDAVHVMELWVPFFESRAKLVEAITLGYEPGTNEAIRAKFTSAIEFSKSIQPHIKGIEEFIPLFGYSHRTIEAELLSTLNAEVAWLTSFDYQVLQKHDGDFSPEETPFRIWDVHNYPNPLKRETTFTYQLSLEADEVSITIYTKSGRKVTILKEASGKEGYNEFMWEARDADGILLANDVYFYRIRAVAGDQTAQILGRLAVLR